MTSLNDSNIFIVYLIYYINRTESTVKKRKLKQ